MVFFSHFGKTTNENGRGFLGSRRRNREEQQESGNFNLGCGVLNCGELSMCPVDVGIIGPNKKRNVNDDALSIPTINSEDVLNPLPSKQHHPVVIFDFDPTVSFDLGISDFSPALDSTVPHSEMTEKVSQEEESDQNDMINSKDPPTVEKRITPLREWKPNRTNPYNEFIATKYNRERIERMLNHICPSMDPTPTYRRPPTKKIKRIPWLPT